MKFYDKNGNENDTRFKAFISNIKILFKGNKEEEIIEDEENDIIDDYEEREGWDEEIAAEFDNAEKVIESYSCKCGQKVIPYHENIERTQMCPICNTPVNIPHYKENKDEGNNN